MNSLVKMMLREIVLLGFFVQCVFSSASVEWKQLDYVFPNFGERKRALSERRFIPMNNIPFDVDVDYRGNGASRIFVTIPRFQEGVPVTLGTVSNINTPNGPLIYPYPSYEWHSSYGRNCNGITSVFRVMIDECRRLWVLDTGYIGENAVCNPQLLAFDLNTDRLVHRYRIPRNQLTNNNLLVNLAVDVLDPYPGGCFNTKVYIANPVGYTMIVYDLAQQRSWAIMHPLFRNDTRYSTFTVAGESIMFEDGILGLAIQKRNPTNYYFNNRQLFFHSFAGSTENSVPLNVLNDGAAFSANPNAYQNQFRTLGTRGIQSAAQATDSKGNLYFGLMDPIGIACWDSSTPYTRDNIFLVAQNDETLQFTTGVKVIPNMFRREELWVLSNRLQKAQSMTYNFNEVNFRIQSGRLDELLPGQKCGGQDSVQYPNEEYPYEFPALQTIKNILKYFTDYQIDFSLV